MHWQVRLTIATEAVLGAKQSTPLMQVSTHAYGVKLLTVSKDPPLADVVAPFSTLHLSVMALIVADALLPGPPV